MELETFLLADAAAGADGKLYIHGGGLTRITPPMLPWLQPQLALVLIFRADPEELAQPHEFQLTLLDPDGAAAMPAVEDEIAPAEHLAAAVPGEESHLHIVLTLSPVRFTRVGAYRFNVAIDGREAGGVNLPVVLQTND
jgi:hypothetical protein